MISDVAISFLRIAKYADFYLAGEVSPAPNVTVYIGGVYVRVQYIGAQGDFAGLDQMNILIPRSLAGRGEVDVLVTVDGKMANPVRIKIK